MEDEHFILIAPLSDYFRYYYNTHIRTDRWADILFVDVPSRARKKRNHENQAHEPDMAASVLFMHMRGQTADLMDTLISRVADPV